MKEIPTELTNFSFDGYVTKHPEKMLAKQINEPFVCRGREYEAGDYIIVDGWEISPEKSVTYVWPMRKDRFEREYEPMKP